MASTLKEGEMETVHVDPFPYSHPLHIIGGILRQSEFEHIARDPQFFHRGLDGLQSPLYIPWMERAVEYLADAIDKKIPVLVVGDRDVDGVSSTALLGSFLKERYGDNMDLVDLRVSDMGDDYGLTGELLEEVKAHTAEIVFLLDMGSAHGDQITELLHVGKRVVVLDHHQMQNPPEDHPNLAFVNPLNSYHTDETEGKIPTTALAFKLLLGYALSLTREWTTGYYISLPEEAEGTLSLFGGRGLLFRCGRYLGSYMSTDDARTDLIAESGDRMDVIVIANGDYERYGLNEDMVRFIGQNPHAGGGLLLYNHIRNREKLLKFIYSRLDLTVLGIIADMVPLRGENRALVRMGLGLTHALEGQQESYSPGYRALVKALRIPEDSLRSRDISWSVAPAVNAAGRMGKTRMALDLLTYMDQEGATRQAKSLLKLNQERKARTSENELIIEELLEKHPEKIDRPVLFVYEERLLPGVSGIVATRLAERFEKPVIYINPDGEYARGSIRSFNGYDALSLLREYGEFFIQFGGHTEAAGFSIAYDSIELFENKLFHPENESLFEDLLSERSSTVNFPYHQKLSPRMIGWDLYRELEMLEPFGQGNPEPIFMIENAKIYKVSYMSDGVHAKFRVDGAPAFIQFVAWRKGHYIQERLDSIDFWNLYGCLEVSYFMGRRELQFRVENMIAV